MTCRLCDITLGPKNRSGYCRKCQAKSPERRVKLVAAMHRRWSDPATRPTMVANAIAQLKAPGVPEKCAAAVQAKATWRLALAARTPEGLKRGAARMRATKLAAIPREYRDEYTRLTRSKRYKAAEAAAIVLAQHEKDMARFRARIGASNG